MTSKTNNERTLSTAQAINEALQVMGARDKNVIFLLRVDDPSAVYGTTKGMVPIYGRDRVIEMPLLKTASAALLSARQCVKGQVISFELNSRSSQWNKSSTMQLKCIMQAMVHKSPIVIRLIIGRGWGQGHSIPKFREHVRMYTRARVIMLFSQDTKGMLIAAIEDDNPVVIIEHRWCHYIKGHVDEGYFTANITAPKLISDDDVTIVATSLSTIELSKQRMPLPASVLKLIFLRILTLDTNPIVESFKTGF